MQLYRHVGFLCSAFRRSAGIQPAGFVAVLENFLTEDCDYCVPRHGKIESYLSWRKTSLLHKRTALSLGVALLFSRFTMMLCLLRRDTQRRLLNQKGWPAFGLLEDPA